MQPGVPHASDVGRLTFFVRDHIDKGTHWGQGQGQGHALGSSSLKGQTLEQVYSRFNTEAWTRLRVVILVRSRQSSMCIARVVDLKL